MLQIAARHLEKITVFDVSGDIDLASSPVMRKVLMREVHENRTARVICNLTQVGYIDSSGIASFVEGLKASRDIGSRLIPAA